MGHATVNFTRGEIAVLYSPKFIAQKNGDSRLLD